MSGGEAEEIEVMMGMKSVLIDGCLIELLESCDGYCDNRFQVYSINTLWPSAVRVQVHPEDSPPSIEVKGLGLEGLAEQTAPPISSDNMKAVAIRDDISIV